MGGEWLEEVQVVVAGERHMEGGGGQPVMVAAIHRRGIKGERNVVEKQVLSLGERQ